MDFTAVRVHFHDLQPFCNSLKISNHNYIKTAKNEHSNDYHYYFKMTISFQCLTKIRYGGKGLGGHAGGMLGSGGGQGVWTPSENHTRLVLSL